MKRVIRTRHTIKRKIPFFKKPVLWLTILILILLGTAVYFFVFFDKFQIKQIIISGNEKVLPEALQELVSQKIERNFLVGNSRSIFLINPKRISEIILEQYPIIDWVKIQRKLPATLHIEVKERKPFAIFCTGSDYFLIDEKGVALESISDELANFFIVRQTGSKDEKEKREKTEKEEKKKAVMGKEVISKEIMEKIIKIKKKTEDRSKIIIKEVNIASQERLDIKTSEGWQVYFNLSGDIDLQIEKLNLILEKELTKKDREELEYIDLRFGNKAYYK